MKITFIGPCFIHSSKKEPSSDTVNRANDAYSFFSSEIGMIHYIQIYYLIIGTEHCC